MTINPIDAQIERLRAAVALFHQTFGRVPTVAFDADGVLYEFEGPYLEHHNRSNPNLPPVYGPFERFDVGYGHTEEVAEALQESMRTLDWSELQPYPAALAVIPVLLEVGLDLSVATAHRVDNVYSPSAKVYQFNRDFDGVLDNRVQIGIDKTRVVADWLVDDKPEVTGALAPLWKHILFTQNYNKDLPGIHVVWETMFEVLAEVIEARIVGREPEPVPVPVAAVAEADPISPEIVEELPANEEPEAVVTEEALADVTLPWADPEPTLAGAHVNANPELTTMPWAEEEPVLTPVVEQSWEDLVTGGEQK